MAKVKAYIYPLRLYRYRPARNLERELRAIREHYLWCSGFEMLNDPMEGVFASSRRVRRADGYHDLKAAVIHNKGRVGICSFSEVHYHELMWAHYADQFQGLCIGYSLRRLLKYLPANVEFVRMYYDEKVPMIRDDSEPPMIAAKKVLSCKNYRWLYEREWRMFASLGSIGYEKTSCVTHVYLGSRMSDNDRNRVRRELADLSIPVSDMTVSKYSISFED
ncbi:MAG TPA: DUF2971 domain-containing protein [Candidatus Angelobacter sp.]|nr:DUF2971 domain-containing protein [Candidatus Angelobacter sp.]